MNRPVCIHHCTPEPIQFFGRDAELALLDRALQGREPSVVAMIGPGGQGKTAIVQTWLQRIRQGTLQADGVFFWSFYRGKDADLCLREMYRYAEGTDHLADVSASYCVDQLLPRLRGERWALLLDGTEVVQHEVGSWHGRFVHPELGRLLAELASEPLLGVVVVTTRFPLPELTHRKHAQVLSLNSLEEENAVALLKSLGVKGTEDTLSDAAALCGWHAKAVELLATWLVEFYHGDASAYSLIPEYPFAAEIIEESRVWRVLSAFQQSLPQEVQDILALTTAFRHPPVEARLLQYLTSSPLAEMLHQNWGRQYPPFQERGAVWLKAQIHKLIQLRLLERVPSGRSDGLGDLVLDCHPLVRRGFEHVLGQSGQQQSARARAGFLSGRPDRRPPQSLAETHEEVELFHAYCAAGMWNDADSVFVALDNPKHRFLAPAFERDLLLRFFPDGYHGNKPTWPGFGRYRSLAIAFEMLGQFQEALHTYRSSDAPLRGDALLALGQLSPLLETVQVEHPWQNLWQAYRCHALSLAGKSAEAVALAKTLIPVDVYEWVHVFECLLRERQLDLLDRNSLLYQPPRGDAHIWSRLARQRMQLDLLQWTDRGFTEMEREYRDLIEEYDRGGLPYERCLTRLSLGRWLLSQGACEQASHVAQQTWRLAARYHMRIVEIDACELGIACGPCDVNEFPDQRELQKLRTTVGYFGPGRC